MLSIGKQLEFVTENDLILRGEFIECEANNSAPVLSFMHGNGFCCRMYQPLLAELNKRFALLLHNAQGHGDSDNGETFAGWHLTSQRLADSIVAHKTVWQAGNPKRKIIGAGHSFGSINTWMAAADNKDLFSALWLMDPVIFSQKLIRAFGVAERFGIARNMPLVKQALARGTEWPSRDAAWQYFYQRGIFKGWQDEALSAYIDNALEAKDNGKLLLKCPPWMEARIFATVPKKLWGRIKTINIPVTVLYGDKTYPFIEPNLKRAQRYNAAMEIHKVNGDHCFMQQHSQAIATHPSLQTLLVEE